MSTLEVKDEMAFQRKEWRAQRIGWGALAVFITLALAGLFGSGPLSRIVEKTDSYELTYERFLRNGSDTVMDIRIPTPLPGSGNRTLWINASLLEQIDIEHVEPAPEHSRMTSNGVEYVFFARDAVVPLISVRYRARSPGRIKGELRIENSRSVALNQFVFP